jgi:FtsP/CotA-like multicopper oxidase with cupredoxin domain
MQPSEPSEPHPSSDPGVPSTSDEPAASEAPEAGRTVSRRTLLGGAGVFAFGAGSAALLSLRGAGASASAPAPYRASGPASHPGHAHGGGALATAPPVAHVGAAPVGYGHGMAPPRAFTREDALALATPPPPDVSRATTRRFDLSVTEVPVEVSDGVVVYAWRYGGRVPGPIIRATEGDRLMLTMENRTGHPHNVHLHGRHDPAMDGIEPIGPGDTFTYDLVAEPFGLHPYHCHTMPISEHIGRGLYGAMIVDPPGGRPPAHEFVLVLSGWDLDGDGRDELVTFNGIAGAYGRHPITVPVGEPVRLYVVNMLEHEPVASFHLHAQTFDVFRSGTSLVPDEHTDLVALTQGERVVLEFTLPVRGRYMFHPHQTHLAERGAMGWFAAV